MPNPGHHNYGANSNHPSDLTLGEIWRLLAALTENVSKLTDTVNDLPARFDQFDNRFRERTEGFIREGAATHTAHDSRIFELEKWRRDTDPFVVLMRERITLLQRLVFGACGAILLTVLGAVMALVVQK